MVRSSKKQNIIARCDFHNLAETAFGPRLLDMMQTVTTQQSTQYTNNSCVQCIMQQVMQQYLVLLPS